MTDQWEPVGGVFWRTPPAEQWSSWPIWIVLVVAVLATAAVALSVVKKRKRLHRRPSQRDSRWLEAL